MLWYVQNYHQAILVYYGQNSDFIVRYERKNVKCNEKFLFYFYWFFAFLHEINKYRYYAIGLHVSLKYFYFIPIY